MAVSHDGKAIVAAILAASRLARFGTEGGASDRKVYVAEFKHMLHVLNHDEEKKPHALHDPL